MKFSDALVVIEVAKLSARPSFRRAPGCKLTPKMFRSFTMLYRGISLTQRTTRISLLLLGEISPKVSRMYPWVRCQTLEYLFVKDLLYILHIILSAEDGTSISPARDASSGAIVQQQVAQVPI